MKAKKWLKWAGLVPGILVVIFLVLPAITATFSHPVSKPADTNREEETPELTVMQTGENGVRAEVEKLLENYKTAELSADTGKLLSKEVRFTGENLHVMQNEVERTEVSYAYEDLMNVAAAYERYQSLPVYGGKVYPVFENGCVSEEILYEKVVENNKEFFAGTDGYELVTELEDEYIRQACNVICQTINKALENPDYNISREDCSTLLWNLCIVKDCAGTTNAHIDKDGKMVLMPTNMETMKGIAMDDQAAGEIISHETFHLMQRASKDRAEALGMDSIYGFSYEFPKGTLKVNSLDNTWIVEGMAEILASEFWEMEPITYQSKISYLNTLEYVHALGNYYKAGEMKSLILQKSIERVFEAFNCQTLEEQMELLKVLYTVNVIQEEPEDFMEAFKETLGHEYSEEELVMLKLQLKNSVCQYFTKIFYSNLAAQLLNNTSSVEDIFELISTYESDMNLHLDYTDETRQEVFSGFFETYVCLQNKFFDQIADCIGVSSDEIRMAYDQFNGKMEIQMKSTLFISDSPERTFDLIEIPWVTKEFERLVNEKHEETSIKKTISIQEYLNILKKK